MPSQETPLPAVQLDNSLEFPPTTIQNAVSPSSRVRNVFAIDLAMEQGTKRKANGDLPRSSEKRVKTKRQWRVPSQNGPDSRERKMIQPGDSGIWATCNKGKERQCIGELRDFFNEHAEMLYGDIAVEETTGAPTADTEITSPSGIENEIQDEIVELQKPSSVQLFTPVRVEVQCVTFFKTIAPIEPVRFVKKICEDAMNNRERKRTRFAKRLSPMTLIGRASEEGLQKVAREVLSPYFHQSPFQRHKFAIRPTLRNHNTLTRDSIIKQVASIVGPGHEVNLRDYELLIVVEVYQNVCGISVLDDSFEKLKRFNIAEIFDPTPNGNCSTEKTTETLASSEVPDNARNSETAATAFARSAGVL